MNIIADRIKENQERETSTFLADCFHRVKVHSDAMDRVCEGCERLGHECVALEDEDNCEDFQDALREAEHQCGFKGCTNQGYSNWAGFCSLDHASKALGGRR